jgi:hypothetical protein
MEKKKAMWTCVLLAGICSSVLFIFLCASPPAGAQPEEEPEPIQTRPNPEETDTSPAGEAGFGSKVREIDPSGPVTIPGGERLKVIPPDSRFRRGNVKPAEIKLPETGDGTPGFMEPGDDEQPSPSAIPPSPGSERGFKPQPEPPARKLKGAGAMDPGNDEEMEPLGKKVLTPQTTPQASPTPAGEQGIIIENRDGPGEKGIIIENKGMQQLRR